LGIFRFLTYLSKTEMSSALHRHAKNLNSAEKLSAQKAYGGISHIQGLGRDQDHEALSSG